MNLDQHRAAFEDEMRKDLGMPEYVELNWGADYVATAWKYYQAALASAEAQAWKKDAERYRFLAAYCRSTHEHWGGRWSIVVDGPCPASHDSEDDFDAAIDAAMEKKK